MNIGALISHAMNRVMTSICVLHPPTGGMRRYAENLLSPSSGYAHVHDKSTPALEYTKEIENRPEEASTVGRTSSTTTVQSATAFSNVHNTNYATAPVRKGPRMTPLQVRFRMAFEQGPAQVPPRQYHRLPLRAAVIPSPLCLLLCSSHSSQLLAVAGVSVPAPPASGLQSVKGLRSPAGGAPSLNPLDVPSG